MSCGQCRRDKLKELLFEQINLISAQIKKAAESDRPDSAGNIHELTQAQSLTVNMYRTF